MIHLFWMHIQANKNCKESDKS